jgi:hypothetical protein
MEQYGRHNVTPSGSSLVGESRVGTARDRRSKMFSENRWLNKAALRLLMLGCVWGIASSVRSSMIISGLTKEVGRLRADMKGAESANDKRFEDVAVATTGTVMRAEERIRRELTGNPGTPGSMLRAREKSFVELYSYDKTNASNYGTAGYLGNGYFLTVKHGVIALGDVPPQRVIQSVKILYDGQYLNAKVVDSGDAQVEVDPGDWAILKVRERVDLPPLNLDLKYSFEYAEPFYRLGNDYSKGIIPSSGMVGRRTANHLITSLADGHPGVSGGGVLSKEGDLVGIPIGRMQGDYRFSFILPLRQEMFKKVPHLWVPPA